MAPSLTDIAAQLIAKAQSASGQLQLDNSIIQSDCYASVLDVLALPPGITVQVPTPLASNIYVQGKVLFVKGAGTAYRGTLPDFVLQLTDQGTGRTASVAGTLSALNLQDLLSENLISNSSLAPLLPSLPFPNLRLRADSNPTNAPSALMTLDVATSGNAWSILPALDIDMTGVGLQLRRTPYLPSLALTGSFSLSGNPVDITLSVPASPAQFPEWTIGLSGGGGGTVANLADLTKLLAGTSVLGQVPTDLASTLSGLSSFGLKSLAVAFMPTSASASTIQSIAVVLGTTSQWPLFGSVAINSVGVQLNITQPFRAAQRQVSAIVYGQLQFSGDKNSALLDVSMSLGTGGTDWVLNAAGYLSMTNPTLAVFEQLPGGYSTSDMSLPTNVSGATLTINYFTISYNPASRQLSYITFSAQLQTTWWIIDQRLGLSNPQLTVYVPGASLPKTPALPLSASASGTITLLDGNQEPLLALTLSASYAKGEAWAFAAAQVPGTSTNLLKLASSLLGISVSASGMGLDSLSISNVAMKVASATKAGVSVTTYSLSGETTAAWQLPFADGQLAIDAKAALAVRYNGTTTDVALRVALNVFGLPFTVSYLLKDNNTQLQLEWEGFQFTYANDGQHKTIKSTAGNWTLGGILTALVNAVKKAADANDAQDFALPEPWSLLNSISLQGLTLTLDLTTKNITISYQLPNTIKLFFIDIDGLDIELVNGSVLVSVQGHYLGNQDIPKWNAASEAPPTVPGAGSELFDLRLAAFGQHVALANVGQLDTVPAFIEAYKANLKPVDQQSNTIPVTTGGGTTPALVFDETSNWMLAADFTVAKFYTLQFVFNDPSLYGMRIGIADGASYFKNLDFEILYKKISDSIGMYQADLQLPDEFRHLEFGEVSITLPNIGVKIYTNGNFYLDFGFPASMTDFSRSFSVQVFPFVGYGGFYFGYLSGATATDLPATPRGQFGTVIEAGLGLSLGVGKTINEGILAGGLSLTAVGIFQGVLGFYTSYVNPAATDVYYRVKATVALVGHIYGSVNFAVVSAQFDIMAYVSLALTIEAYKAIPVVFEAGVRVSLTVKINLGFFKISISLSFSATINASFTIGSDDPKGGLWKRDAAGYELAEQATRLLQAPAPVPTLVWQPLTADLVDRFPLTLHFLPHLTVSTETGPQQAAYVAMLYIEAPAADAQPASAADTSSLGSLATGVLAWAINALLNSSSSGTTYAGLLGQPVSADDLTTLLSLFDSQPNNVPPFSYRNQTQPGLDVQAFLQQLFTVNIVAADPTQHQTIDAAVFPPLPDLQLQDLRNAEPLTTVDFATKNLTGETYIGDITALLQRLGVNAPNNLANEQAAAARPLVDNRLSAAQNSQSLPTFFFADYVALLAKNMLQKALDYLTAAKLPAAPVSEVLAAVRTTATIAGLAGMASRFLLHGLRLPAPPVPPATGLGPVQPFYVLTGQQIMLPELAATDTYQLQLLKAATTTWIAFAGGGGLALPVAVDANERTRATQTAGLTLAPNLAADFPKVMVNYFDHAQPFTLGSPAQWQYPGTYFEGQEPATNPYLLKLPDNLRAELARLAAGGQAIDFTLQSLSNEGVKSPVKQFCWATAVTVTLQKLPKEGLDSPIAANRYSLIGTDDAGVSYLHHLVAYLQTSAGQNFAGTVQLLYQPDPVGNALGGYISAANNTTTPGDKLAMAIVQANLSTDTNPESAMLRGFAAAAPVPSNTLNTFADFVALLWECSIVRSGGYYFYYQNKADNNAGLPDALFDANGAAKVQVLITYPEFQAQPFLNSVVIGDALDYSSVSVAAQSTALLVRSAILQPGSVGYVLQRTPAADYNPTIQPPTADDDKSYLENQFNLVGISLPDVPAYQNLLPAGPLDTPDPTGQLPSPDTSWSYSGVVPYAQFVQPADTLYGFADPYAGVGTTVELQLNWQDMFGNTLPFATSAGVLNSDLFYTDPLLAVSQWPSVAVGYQFVVPPAGTAPELQLVFGFPTATPARYQGAAGPDNARIDLYTWMRLWFQLQHASDLSLSFTASIDGTAAAPLGSVRAIDLGALQTQLVRPVIDYLYTLANTTTPLLVPLPQSYTISSPIAPDSITSYIDVFPLAVSLTLARIHHVDPNFASDKNHLVSGVDSAVTVVQPLADPGSSTAKPITEFAQQFEAAFNTSGPVCLKVATATNLSTDASTGSPIWIIRFDTSGGNQGICLKYQLDAYGQTAAAYYAPIPLGRSPLSIDAQVAPYTTGSAALGTPVPMHFTGIDLDSWGQQLLEAVDRFLTPAYAVPAFLLDNGTSLQQILDAKQQLADAITGTVDSIIRPAAPGNAAPPASNVRNAQQKWRQQLLMQLASAYAYTASVQTPVTVTSHFQGPNNDPPVAQGPPRLYGQLLPAPTAADGPGPGLSQQEFTLSTAKLPIGAGASWLTYLFQCKDAANFSSFAFDNLRFAVSHLEWNYAPGIGDYLSSAWLALVLPTTLPVSFTDLGSVRVPVPLRAYPTPPSVTEQRAMNPSMNQAGLANDVLKARSWDYQFSYRTSGFAQDTVAVQVQFNVSSEGSLLARDSAAPAPTLPETLAQFVSVYPALSADFDQYLTKITDSSPGPAQPAVQVFIGLVKSVAAAWSVWNQVNPLNPTGLFRQAVDLTIGALPITLNYQVEESAQDETGDLLITVTANTDNPLLTTALPGVTKPLLLGIDIPSYQPMPTPISNYQVQYTYTSTDPATLGQALRYDQRNLMPTRQATAPTVDILNQQNAWAGLCIVRNQDLLPVPGSSTEWQETNSNFVYRTPLVMFFSELAPLFANDASGESAIDINDLPGTATPRSLDANLAALGRALTQQVGADITELTVKAECKYAYALAPGLPVTMPVLLALPFDLSTGDQGQDFAQSLTTALQEWQRQHQPATAEARWLFNVSVFSAYAAGPPMLQLSFELKVSDLIP